MFKLLTSYLNEWSTYVKISSSSLLAQGVPQGSISGPLFLNYINDLPNASDFETTLFC